MHKFLILGLVSCVLGAPAVALADPAYSVKIDAPPGKTAQKGVVKIVIQPGTGFHVNKDYPTSLTLTGIPAGVLVDKMKQTAKDAAKLTEQEAEFDVSYTASAAGKQTVTGDLKFAVCSANSCDPKKEKLTFVVDIK
jgi:hypothetical protein